MIEALLPNSISLADHIECVMKVHVYHLTLGAIAIHNLKITMDHGG
ncbi:hypothetical protein PVAP13_9KG292913 [Panicum virgatum]|uniref:Uncharacterized protein n=1 Tax=Panicum virgatum TaxID=38727 RepID=A0A8T0NPE7_PANVG|nr:hypothetical protein PVAP13_9KG292913 [Panicum virgatum]